MAKRKRTGVNTQKKQLQRKTKTRLRVKRLLPRLVVLALILAMVSGLVYGGIFSYEKIQAKVATSHLFNVRSIIVKGTHRLDKKKILERAGFKSEVKLYAVKPAVVMASLSAEPWVERARCVRRWWGSVVIEIVERKPIALINSGSIQLVDRYGIVLPCEAGKVYDLPLVSGVKSGVAADGLTVIDSLATVRLVRVLTLLAEANENLPGLVAQLDLSDKVVIHMTMAESPAVIAIDNETTKEQLINLACLIDVLKNDTLRLSRIDMRYQNLAFLQQE